MKDLAKIAAIYLMLVAGIWWLFYWLRNAIAADVLGLPELTFWQSVGLLILANLLTGGFREAFTKSK